MRHLALIIFLFTTMAYGSDPKFLNKWMKLPVAGNNKDGSYQLMKRIVPVGTSYFAIGEISSLVLPNLGDSDMSTVAKSMAQGFEIQRWMHRTVEDAHVYEAKWEKGRRYIRLAMRKDDKDLRVSIATYRSAYHYPLYAETEVIQRLFLAGGKRPFDWSKGIVQTIRQGLEKLGVANVYAQSPIDWGSIFGSGSGGTGTGFGGFLNGLDPNTINQLSGQIDQLNQNIGSGLVILNDTNTQISIANGNWANSNNNWANSNNNWSETNNQLGSANQNWQETNNILREYQGLIQGLQGTLQTEMSETRTMIDNNWRETNRIADGYLHVMQDMTNPKKMAILAGATAAGAALGATAVNLAVSGVKAGVGFLVKWIRGDFKEKKHQEMLDEFKKARESYEKTSDGIAALESSVDSFLKVLELANLSQIPFDHLLTEMTTLKHVKQTELELAKDKLKQQVLLAQQNPNDTNCQNAKYKLAEDVANLERFVKAMEDISKRLQGGMNLASACADFKKAIGQILLAEEAMENHRRDMIATTSAYIEELNRRYEKQQDVTNDLNRGRDDRRVKKKVRSSSRLVDGSVNTNLKKREENFDKACYKLLSGPAAHQGTIKRGRVCNAIYNDLTAELAAMLSARTPDELMNSNDADFMAKVDEVLKKKLNEIYPNAANNTDTSMLHAQLLSNLRDPLALGAQEVYGSQEAQDVIAEVVAEARQDNRTHADDQFTTNPRLFAEAIRAAQDFRHQLERELSGMERIIDPQTGKVTMKVVQLQNTRLDRLKGKQLKLQQICGQ